ncbi:PAS domain-containing protein [Erythrobacter sp. SCSIO 43205]|uniref:CheR family methyltransferase n=1 Tax=Erythrobacter sp. SCSIO 43205 TaxID=2779361 RepID=UPI001CA8150D|nr:CheR family methyltransferase [Erythrobacter sp. SCSIO 43205]UAB77924.1 PAS domain-containing protein [Erythrobacter sp. SCSIO 43205]
MNEPEVQAQLDFPVVAIGVSAGGLDAATRMFREVATGTGLAFVLIAHLDPDHESMMAELLAGKTALRVRQIEDGDSVEVDCLHVIPPGSNLRLAGGRFELVPFDGPRGARRPIDSFFTALAEVQGDRAAGVVLSGTGSDGTAGLRVIKELGGIAIAQSPKQSAHDGMPQSAIATQLVDFTLEAEAIVPRLKSYFASGKLDRFVSDDATCEAVMQSIFTALKDEVGTDFSGYKRSTLTRRLNRRMQVLEIEDVSSYLIKLKTEKTEQQALASDFLIHVTSFFRDAANFERLRTSVIGPLIENADESDEIRVWVPGCSSGQEAFSLAMMVEEMREALEKPPMVTIFATDIDEAMIEQGQRASYPISMLGEIPPRYRERYTQISQERFEISPRLREMVRFSVHNVAHDPPFSQIDLISCRNLLIYLGEDLQRGVFPLLHFGLRVGGYLFLGTSEGISRGQDLFAPVDPKARIFRRNDKVSRSTINLPMVHASTMTVPCDATVRLAQERDFPRQTSFEASRASIYEHYAPPFVRVTREGQVLDSSGDLSLFMMSRPGDERRIEALLREGLREVVQPLVEQALNSHEPRVLKDIEIASPFGTQTADVFAHPMQNESVAVIFVAKDRLQPLADEFVVQPISRDRRIANLQGDLNAARLALKDKLEQIETANEELKSANEEMMSMNEELQSANEELTTANEELKHKIDELTQANADLDNVMRSADLVMIVLDQDLRIRHLTNPARELLSLDRGDEGRSLAEIKLPPCGIDLINQLRTVIETGKAFTQTSDLDEAGRAYFLRIHPYYAADGSVEGASLTMVDISQEVTLRRKLAEETRKLKLAMEAANMGSWITDLETGRLQVDAIGAQLAGLDGPGEYGRDALGANLTPLDTKRHFGERDAALAKGEGYSQILELDIPGAPRRWVKVDAVPVEGMDGRKKVVGLGIDVTEIMVLQRELTEQTELRELVMNAGRMGLGDLDVERSISSIDAVMAEHLNLASAGKIPFDKVLANVVEEDIPILQEKITGAIERGEEYEVDFRVKDPSVGIRWLRSRGKPYTTLNGAKKVAGPTLDISPLKNQQMLLEEMSHRIENLFAVVGGLIQAAPKEHPQAERLANDLLERIVSLGRVYDLARKDNSMKGVPLEHLLKSIIEPHATGQNVSLEGPAIFVDGDQVNTLTLIIHELATNAAKYGALGAPDGELAISWTVAGKRTIELKWLESRNDFCPQTNKHGFGSLLIDTGARQLKGKFSRRFLENGAAIDLSFTL